MSASSSYVAVPTREFTAFTKSLDGLESKKVTVTETTTPNGMAVLVTEKSCKKERRGFRPFLLWIIFSIIIGFILYFAHPSIVTSVDRVYNTYTINWLALVFWSLLFGAIVLGIVALIIAFTRGARQRRAEEASC